MFYSWVLDFMVYLTFISVSAAEASPVKDLTCEGPNKTNAEIILSWTKPNGRFKSFQINRSNSETIKLTSTCNPNCNHTISNLSHNTAYNLVMTTLSCGLPSTSVSLTCMTGITRKALFFVDNMITIFYF